jgi:hypothetical protein
MPFESKSQQRFMYAKHPEIAKEFQEKTPKGKDLPEHAAKKKALGKVGKKYGKDRGGSSY